VQQRSGGKECTCCCPLQDVEPSSRSRTPA
jgi:hypothetical protein